jgi:hypothetical protein
LDEWAALVGINLLRASDLFELAMLIFVKKRESDSTSHGVRSGFNIEVIFTVWVSIGPFNDGVVLEALLFSTFSHFVDEVTWERVFSFVRIVVLCNREGASREWFSVTS